LTRRAAFLLAISVMLAQLRPLGGITLAVDGEQYVYFGYVPANIWLNDPGRTVVGQPLNPPLEKWSIDPSTVATTAILAVVGNVDGAHVEVLDLSSRQVLASFTVDKLRKVVTLLPNGTFFKVVADQPVTVLLAGGKDVEIVDHMYGGGSFISTFFTSTQGAYLGKEFVFMAVQSKHGEPYLILALEDSQVAVWDENGTKVFDAKLAANEAQSLGLVSFRVYHVVSTGTIMVQSFTSGRSSYYPAVRGGYVGRLFYGASTQPGPLQPDVTFLAVSTEENRFKVMDLTSGKVALEEAIPAQSNVSFTAPVSTMVVESERPMTLMYLNMGSQHGADHAWYGCGVTYLGFRAEEEGPLYVPNGETYVFGEEGTVVSLDDAQIRIPESGHLEVPVGLHRLSASRNIAVEIVAWPSWPENQGVANFGTCVPSLQAFSMGFEDLKLTPLGPQVPWLYIIAGASAVGVLALMALMLRRRR